MKCKQKVYPSGAYGAFYGHQCSRAAVKDGFCNQHHPETIAAKNKEKDDAYRANAQKAYDLRLKKEKLLADGALYPGTLKALKELLEAIELIEDITFTRDLLPHESEAIWNDAVTRAKAVIK